MFKVKLICVGKLRDRWLKEGCAEYQKRLGRFCDLEIAEVPESRAKDMATMLKEEQEFIAPRIAGHCAALAIEGERMDSRALSGFVSGIKSRGERLTLIIGGSHGLSDGVKQRADSLISMSDMTFPHTMARVMLLEQLYRAFMIDAGSDYHK